MRPFIRLSAGLELTYKYGLGWVLLAMIRLPAVWLSSVFSARVRDSCARRYNAVTLNGMLLLPATRSSSVNCGWRVGILPGYTFVGSPMTITTVYRRCAPAEKTAAGIPYETGLLRFSVSAPRCSRLWRLPAPRAERHHADLCMMMIGTVCCLLAWYMPRWRPSNAVQTCRPSVRNWIYATRR